MGQKIVMKFGGTSVGSPEAIENATIILQKNIALGYEILVVVSAASGVTDALNLSILQAQGLKKGNFYSTLAEVSTRFEEIANKLLVKEIDRSEFLDILTSLLFSAHQDCKLIQNNSRDLEQLKDRVLAIGERIQIHLVSAAFVQSGLRSIPLEATEFIITDDEFQNATPIQAITTKNIQVQLSAYLKENRIPVITGFIGSTQNGKITTLGRGGSDYTAALIASGVDADELWIWTDVDGLMTTDPLLVTNAQLISEISYQEVYDLAFFGAKVLHPKTILPLEGKGIPVRIKNSFNVKNKGTTINLFIKNQPAKIKAVTGTKKVSILSIRKRRYEEMGQIISLVKKVLGESQLQVLGVFQNSNKDTSYLAINNLVTEDQLKIFEHKLGLELPGRKFPRLSPQPDQTLITAVGHQIQKNRFLSTKIQLALEHAGIVIKADAYKNKLHSLSFLIAEQDHLKAIQQIHNEVLSYAAI